MNIHYYVVKSFTDNWMHGNPAAVVALNYPVTIDIMQRIAFINGFPETVFLLKGNEKPLSYKIWWFTPTHQVFDAGHATLAAQYILYEFILPSDVDSVRLLWVHGQRIVPRSKYDTVTYDYCASFRKSSKTIEKAVGNIAGHAIEIAEDLVVFLDNAEEVKKFIPDYPQLCTLRYRGLAVTAPDQQFDYCSRFFAPRFGVNEDFVTATSHVYLAEFWMGKLKKSTVTAIQYSKSPGTLICSDALDGIQISGVCKLFSEGKLHL